MTNLREKTLAELVTLHTEVAAIFEKHRLDFCCKGKRSLEAACQSQGLDVDSILQELEVVFQKSTAGQTDSIAEMPLDKMVDYLMEKHHRYVRQMIPIITAHTAKTRERHGSENENLAKIAALWVELSEELAQHLLKEEDVLLPYIKHLAMADRGAAHHFFPKTAFVTSPISVLENEHDRTVNIIAEINNLSNQYKPPLNACTTYRLCFRELQEFEADLHRHLHFENHILFPKAKEVERRLLRNGEKTIHPRKELY